MPTKPIAGKGSKLQVQMAGVYVDIPMQISLKGVSPEAGTFDATSLLTTLWKEKLPTGYIDPGTFTCSTFLKPSDPTFKYLNSLLTSMTIANWQVVYSDGTAVTMTGILTKFDISIEMEDGVKMDTEITLTGPITLPT